MYKNRAKLAKNVKKEKKIIKKTYFLHFLLHN